MRTYKYVCGIIDDLGIDIMTDFDPRLIDIFGVRVRANPHRNPKTYLAILENQKYLDIMKKLKSGKYKKGKKLLLETADFLMVGNKIVFSIFERPGDMFQEYWEKKKMVENL